MQECSFAVAADSSFTVQR